MGCGQSKIENEEAVTRCKDRKQFMKQAVTFRNAFAAAHSAYAMSLKNTGAALSDFAHGEVKNPTSIITTSNTSTTTIHQSLPATSASETAQPPPPPHPDILPPPPPPSSSPFPTSPLHRAVSMPEMKTPLKSENSIPVGPAPSTIMEEEDDDDDDEIESEKLVTRKRGSRREVENDPPPVVVMTSASPPPPTTGGAHDSRWAEISEYIFQPQESMMGPGLTAVEEVVKEDKVFDERPKRVEEVRKSVKTSVVEASEKVAVVDTPVVVVGGGGGSVGKSVKKGGKVGGERKMEKGSVNLLQIFFELDDHFLKASESAHEVSKMLEAKRLHYHSNFADNRGNDLRPSDECCYIVEFRYINWNNDSVEHNPVCIITF